MCHADRGPAGADPPADRRGLGRVRGRRACAPVSPRLHPAVESRVGQSVANTLLGMGGLEPWLANERVEELHAIGYDQVTVRFHRRPQAAGGPDRR